MTDRELKYNASRMDIINDIYDEIQKAKAKFSDDQRAMEALDEIEGIAIWWSNAPAVVMPQDKP